MSLLVLFTDFGIEGPYVGLLKLALLRGAPQVPVIDLFHGVPAFDCQGAAYLLAAYAEEFSAGTVFLGVVDPEVGGMRAGVILRADGQLYVGPENGLFDRIAARAREVEAWHIVWEPPRLSASFHGRDLFAPVAAMLASGRARPDDLGVSVPVPCRDWPDDLARIVYTDRYGNAMTGIRAASLDVGVTLRVQGRTLARARTFSEVPKGQGFWYENANGLAELAVNQGSAADRFRLRPGEPLEVLGNTFTGIRER